MVVVVVVTVVVMVAVYPHSQCQNIGTHCLLQLIFSGQAPTQCNVLSEFSLTVNMNKKSSADDDEGLSQKSRKVSDLNFPAS